MESLQNNTLIFNLSTELADIAFQFGHFLLNIYIYKMGNYVFQMHFLLKCPMTCDKTTQKTKNGLTDGV